jgi:hypothetical protein
MRITLDRSLNTTGAATGRARIDPNAKLGEWQGKFENAPADPKARAKAIDKAHKGLAKNAARHARG